MAIHSDDLVSLPGPPPPRPAARKAAIDAALRKFDGIEEIAGRSGAGRPPTWATMYRRPLGALVTAALVAVISIPAIQVALRDDPPEVVTEAGEPPVAQPVQNSADTVPAPPAPPPARAEEAVVSQPASGQAAASPLAVAEGRANRVSGEVDRKASLAPPPMAAPAPPPLVASPPSPPPPPPPSAPAETQQEASDTGSIVVTGSRVRRPNMESASPVTIVDPHGEFLSLLQAGLGSNDRRAVIRLIALPLRVNFGSGTRTYRSSREVERDFDRIFTADVRRAALELRPDTMMVRDGGRLKGNGRIWFGCARSSCPSDSSVRIREVNP